MRPSPSTARVQHSAVRPDFAHSALKALVEDGMVEATSRSAWRSKQASSELTLLAGQVGNTVNIGLTANGRVDAGAETSWGGTAEDHAAVAEVARGVDSDGRGASGEKDGE